MNAPTVLRFLITGLIVLAAAWLGHALWHHYMYSPWTRDGRIRADVVKLAPDVSGLVTQVAVRDNQLVHKGQLLFVIDQDRYRYALAQAQADLAAAKANAKAAGANINAALASVEQRQAEYQMYQQQAQRRIEVGDVISREARDNAVATANSAQATLRQAQASGHQASASRDQAVAAVQQAQAAVDTAQLNLQRTEVRAPVDGYVTNFDLRLGDYATTGTPVMALIDIHSYYIYGYFEETKLPYLHVGDPVEIRLLSGGARLQGSITGVARGITDSDNPTGADLLADVSPTFNWVRLAQRVPVRVEIDSRQLPPGVMLAAGMTATLVVKPSAHPGPQLAPAASAGS